MENQTEPKESFWTKKRTRRENFALEAAGAIGLTLTALGLTLGNSNKKPKEQVEAAPKTGYDRLNSILEMGLGTEEKKASELQYVNDAETLDQIDAGLDVVIDWQLRIKLLDKRYKIRLDGPEEITSLRKPTKEELDWCNKPHAADELKKKIHPEELMRDTDDYFLALKDLENKEAELGRRKLLELYKQDLIEEEKAGRISKEAIMAIPLTSFLPNPGTMLGIRFHESRALAPQDDSWHMGANIGEKPVEDFIHGETPEETKRLMDLFNLFREALSAAGPLKYPSRSIPGSEKSADIGSNQFSVETLWNHFKFLRNNFGIIFNPIGTSARAAYLFLGRGSAWTDTKTGERMVQKGYLVGDKLGEIDLKTEFKEPALDKQNPTLRKVNFQWAQEYDRDIVKTGIFGGSIIPWYRQHYGIKAV